MTLARIHLVVATVLFVGWLGWLGYLAFAKKNPVVISRSQVMVATHVVVAEVSAVEGQPNPEIVIVKVLKPSSEQLTGTLRVRHLHSARLPFDKPFADKGIYLLTLAKTGQDYALVGPPRAPGFNPVSPAFDGQPWPRPWVYPWTPELEKQLAGLLREP